MTPAWMLKSRQLRHTIRFASGIALVIVGIIGLILPVMPGWIFVIPGLIILGDYIPPVKRLIEWAKSKIPESVWKRESQNRAGGAGV